MQPLEAAVFAMIYPSLNLNPVSIFPTRFQWCMCLPFYKMRILLLWIPIAIIALIGMLVIFGDAEPAAGRYQDARKVVNKTTNEIRDFYAQSNTLPKDLSFIKDPELRKAISDYNITFDPVTKRIASSNNWTYYPDNLYRFTFGVLGDARGRSVGDPGFTFEYELPGDVQIAEE